MNTKYKTGDVVVCHTKTAQGYGWRKDRPITITGYKYFGEKNYYKVTYMCSNGLTEDFLPISFMNTNFRPLNKVERLLYVKV